ncbi:DNA-binding domain-containing protein [Maricaulis sp.]|uniref:DNA-binding domain-containing protein n=1 Tax=Maricaulis sp. TaxID=1486257 RepID=UPI00261FF546|nr:DNA-binding domain-containing protein [Maricaulis sp.]
MSETFYQDWSAALRSGDAKRLQLYLADDSARRRFAVYRNNVVSAAIEALRAGYPVVNQLVGDSFFSPMAKLYWDEHPPQTRSMTLYGSCFADHIAAYGPAAELGYLPEIARLDRAWLETHHAGEAEVLTGATVSALDPQALPSLAPGLHPSVRAVTLSWPVYDIWAAHRAARPLGETALEPAAQHVLLWRHQGQIGHAVLSPAHHAFLGALGAGSSLEQAVSAASSLGEDDDPAGFFGHALSHGLLAAPALQHT